MKTRTAAAWAMSVLLICTLSGCMKHFKDPEIAHRLENAPPIMLDDSESVHILVMRAPNPGWSIRVDRDERIRDGERVYVTIRRPDPTMLYPQVIVDKNLRTRVRTESPIEIHARVLAFDESFSGGYAPLEAADSFED